MNLISSCLNIELLGHSQWKMKRYRCKSALVRKAGVRDFDQITANKMDMEVSVLLPNSNTRGRTYLHSLRVWRSKS